MHTTKGISISGKDPPHGQGLEQGAAVDTIVFFNVNIIYTDVNLQPRIYSEVHSSRLKVLGALW